MEETIRRFVEAHWSHSVKKVEFLAAGEYNANYLVSTIDARFVFRLNHGSQLNLDNQIEYEYSVLKAVANSGVTPRVYAVDPAPLEFDGGVLLMDYIPGRPLDYRTDTQGAAEVFARIHSLPTAPALITQANPVLDIAAESYGLIRRYDDHLPKARSALLRYYESIVQLGERAGALFQNESMCIVNTEVNSRNFIVQAENTFLVDWEKAVNSYRYQDLGHFVVPTTTLWKSDQVYTEDQKKAFLSHYRSRAGLDIDLDELYEKTKILERTILLRALSWCYMAHYEYTRENRSLKDSETFSKIKAYLQDIESYLRL